MRKEIGNYFKAFKWYNLPCERQYDNLKKAERYDEAAKLLTDREGFADFLLEQLGKNPGKTIEIAAGTGLISQALDNNGLESFFVDISGPVIDILKKRVNSPIVQADFCNLPFQDNTFDTLVCVGGYRCLKSENRDSFWAEAKRIIRPEGRVFIGQFYPRGSPLHGSDIDKDKTIVNHGIFFRDGAEYKAKIDLVMGVNIKSGRYLLHQFSVIK